MDNPLVKRDLRALPKAHLHVHVESTNSVGHPGRDRRQERGAVATSPKRLECGFAAFADANSLIRACLRRPEDFERIGREFCEEEATQGVGYAEVTFTAASHGERLGDLDMPLPALLRGLTAGHAATGPECRVLLDHSRRRSVARAWRAR